MLLHEVLTRWCLWMTAGQHSARTIGARHELVLLFARRSNVDVILCGWEPIAHFLADDRLGRGTRQTYRAHLRAWYRWLVTEGMREDNPVDRLSRVRPVRRAPRPVETDQLGQALSSGRFYRRTRTMIILAAYQGLRAHEIARFRGEQIHGDHLRVTGKGDVEAELPLHELVAAEAARYPRIGLWFPSPADRSKPITDKNVSAVVSQALHRAGVNATCHQLRHWYGTNTLRSSGGNLRVAQELLRHASPATTALYTLIDDHELRQAVDGLPVPLHAVPRA